MLVFAFRESFTMDDQLAFEDVMDSLMVDDNLFVVAVRAQRMPMPSLPVLRRLANWNRANKPRVIEHAIGTALFLPSPLLRGALGFINRLSPPPTPQALLATWEETELWAIERLAERGLEVPGATVQSTG